MADLYEIGAALAERLRACGGDVKQARAAAGILAGTWVDTAAYFAFWAALGQRAPATLGLQVADTTTVIEYEMAHLAALYSPDVRGALEKIARYKRLCGPKDLILEPKGRELSVYIRWPTTASGMLVPARLVDAALASMLVLLRRGSGTALSPVRVDLMRPRSDEAMLRRFYGCDIRFGQPRDALVLATSQLDVPFLAPNADLVAVLVPSLEAKLKPRQSESFVDEVTRAIVRRMAGDRPSVQKIARELAVSTRTLQRRLGERGTTYQQVLDDARHDAALRLLREKWPRRRRDRVRPRLRGVQLVHARLSHLGTADAAAVARSDETTAQSDWSGRAVARILSCMNTESKVWLITGSSRGLGRALAEEVLEAGHRLVATARKPSDLAELTARYGDRVRAVALDVTDEAAAVAAVRVAVDTFGALDVVVNNAGYANTASFEDMAADDFRAQMDTNFYGAVYLTRAALPVLRAQRSGTILQISSIGGRRGGTPGLSAYQAAKFALEGFSDVVAAEVAPLGIRVIIVEPGGFATDWGGASMTVHPVRPDYASTVGAIVEHVRKSADVGRGDPRKAAHALLAIVKECAPPRRLLLGTDALFLARVTETERGREAETWQELTSSTDREGFGNFADSDIAKHMTSIRE